MSDHKEKVLAAANKIRRDGIPDELAPLVSELLEKHREMEIGPADEGGWPKGWLAVDKAQNDLAQALVDMDEPAST